MATKKGKSEEPAAPAEKKAQATFKVYRCGPGPRQEVMVFQQTGEAIETREAAERYAGNMSKSLPKRSAVWFDVRKEN